MENISIIEVENQDGTTTKHIIIDRGNGEFTSMPKEIYDKMQDATSGIQVLNQDSDQAEQGVKE